MYPRLLKLPNKRSFFLFGARNTGKSTLIFERFPEEKRCHWIDLLNVDQEEFFTQHPMELEAIVLGLGNEISHVVIDEVQKVPKLLNVVQGLIRKTDKKFVLTGSSARRLKQQGANLLAGRAFVYHLFPLSAFELGVDFNLHQAMHYGTLPEVIACETDQEKEHFLQTYTRTYIKEEIWNEHFIRNLDHFRKFLDVAAQCNGKIVNFAKIARDVGVDDKTVRSYFSILEDTLIGFFLNAHHNSFRKQLTEKPKFYFFDTGIVRALMHQLTAPLNKRTSSYGFAFEHLVILEIIKLGYYFYPEWRFSYLQTKGGSEIDLIIERPGQKILCIEIKSTDTLLKEDVSSFIKLTSDIPDCEAVCLSQDRFLKQYDHVKAFPWKQGIAEIFHLNK